MAPAASTAPVGAPRGRAADRSSEIASVILPRRDCVVLPVQRIRVVSLVWQDTQRYRGLIRQNRPNFKTRARNGPRPRRGGKRDLVLDGFPMTANIFKRAAHHWTSFARQNDRLTIKVACCLKQLAPPR